ncbi:MAG: hypothetical protein IJJ04_03385 [Clostridia bacterium]|nr:hypothetical protein [Clostridia bacterium]
MKFKNLKIYLLTIFTIFLFSLKTQAINVDIGGILLPNNVFNNNRNANIAFTLTQARTFIQNNDNQSPQLLLIERMLNNSNNVQITYQGNPIITINENNDPTVTQSVIFSLGNIPLTNQGTIRFNGNQIFIDFVSTNINNLHHIDITNTEINQNNLNNLFNNVITTNRGINFLRRLDIPAENESFSLFLRMMNNNNYNIDHLQRIRNNNREHLYVILTNGNICSIFDFFYNIQQ